MRAFPLLATVLVLSPALAAAPARADQAVVGGDDNDPRLAAETFTPAPVPGVVPATSADGAPAPVPEQISPPGIGNNVAGPANATPFSSTPSADMPPDAAMPDRRDGTLGGAGGIVPNVSK